MESLTKNKKTREQIKRMVEENFEGVTLAEGEDAVVEMKDGWFNVAYGLRLSDGIQTILKIAPPRDAEILTYEKNIMRTEVETMRRIKSETDLRVPAIYAYDDSKKLCDAEYFFMEFLEGVSFDHIKHQLEDEINEAVQKEMGLAVRKINNIKQVDTDRVYFGYDGLEELQGETWRETFLKMIRAILKDGEAKGVILVCTYEELIETVEKHAHVLDLVTESCLVHWDLWDGNVLYDEGAPIGLLDFERALWGDPLMETQFRFFEPLKLEGYGKMTFTDGELLRCKLYDIYLFLIMMIECSYREYDDPGVYMFAREQLERTMKSL